MTPTQLIKLAPHQLDNSHDLNQSRGLKRKSTKSVCIASKNALIFKQVLYLQSQKYKISACLQVFLENLHR